MSSDEHLEERQPMEDLLNERVLPEQTPEVTRRMREACSREECTFPHCDCVDLPRLDEEDATG